MTYVVYIKSGVKKIKYATAMNRATNEASIWRLHESCYLMETDDTFDRDDVNLLRETFSGGRNE